MHPLFTRLLRKGLHVVSTLSWKNLYLLSDIFKFWVFDILQYRKRVILNNLHNSFPFYSDRTINRIARRFHRNFADIIFETIKLKTISKEEILERGYLDTTLLDRYHDRGQSIVVVAGHLGNWEMLNLYATVLTSYQLVIVYHELANKAAGEWMNEMRTRFGTKMVPMKDAMGQAMAMKDEPVIYILINDQSPAPEKAYWTKFLHQDTGVFRGAELIARRINSPVLYMSAERDELRRGHYAMYLKLITENPKQEPVNAILQKQIELLEKDIIRQPDNWLWSHRRWKHSRPANLRPSQQLPSRIQK